jgi:hypothetical protein
LELCASIQVQCWLTVLCSETRPNANPETVMPHAYDNLENSKIHIIIISNNCFRAA